MRGNNPKNVGSGRRQEEGESRRWNEGVDKGELGEAKENQEKKGKTFQKDHHQLHIDRHGLPGDRLCYLEKGEGVRRTVCEYQ